MREEAITAGDPEPNQNHALGRTDTQASDQASESGRRRQGRIPDTTLSRHATKCRICNHPDRAAIEFDFLNWRNPGDLVKGYRFRGLSTIYRHAHATGLFAKRRLNLRFAMERIVERVNEVPVTATSVIRAARAISRINDSGEWIDPPSRVIVTHINQPEDCKATSIAEAEASPPPRRRDMTKTSAGSARSSLRVSRESRLSLDTSARSGGRGFSPDRKTTSSLSSSRARPAGQGSIPDIAAHDSSETISRPSLIFDDALLDEPSDSASAELPRIDGKPAPPEVILQLTPEFGSAVQERRRVIEADRAARSAGSQTTASTPSSLPQAVFPNSAPSALPHPAANENNVADVKQSVAMPSTSLPPAAPDKPATAKQSPRAAGPPLGSSGSADPPFPFTPEPLRRWKPRRRF